MSGLEVAMCEYGSTEKIVYIHRLIECTHPSDVAEDYVNYLYYVSFIKILFLDTEHIVIILYAFAKFGREKRITYHNCIRNF